MDFQKLLQNKTILFSIIGGVVLFIIIIVIIACSGGNNNSEGQMKEDPHTKESIKYSATDFDNAVLIKTDNIGKVIELEALLSKHNIKTKRKTDGQNTVLALSDKSTLKDRDDALLLIVQSGLADANVGLEVFDKGDFTSTKDDKKIRLARAINGELSRLIRKIDPIENASVFISIPEQTLFSSMQKPRTATVQLVLPVGEKLSKDKVRAITNLLLGSVSELDINNISITDTNGNVYSSMAAANDGDLEKIEENDEYMKAKVQAQLDKLLGKGNYVVTVSTYLRQVPMERSSVIYDPERNVVLNEQEFNENLGDKNNENGQVTNAVSLYLPSGLPQSATTSQNRSYSRTASEKQYGSTKTQVSEYLKPGMIEDISIAVTVENNSIPEMISIEDLKHLIATAASPKVSADNVSIIFADAARPALAGDKDIHTPAPEGSGNPWWTMALVLLILVFIGWFLLSKRVSMAAASQDQQIESLKNLASQQENKLQEVNQRAQVLLAQQDQIQQSINTMRQAPPVAAAPVQAIPDNSKLIEEMHKTVEEDEDEVALQIKNWIESD